MFKLIIVLSLLSSVLAQDRIVNGVDAIKNEFKFMVSLQRNDTHFCGGTVLDKTHILTAAHCVCNVKWNISLLSIKLTSLTLNSSDAVVISADDVTCNNYDNLELIRDVAIIHIDEEIPSNKYKPVKLPENNFSTAVTLDGIIIGWGLTSKGGHRSNILQKLEVIVYDDATCSESYHETRNIDHQICAGWPGNGRGSCQGDSGGPLLVDDIQIGIVSFGDGADCAISDRKRPKILARVSKYISWIKAVLEVDNDTEQGTNNEEMTTVTDIENGDVNTVESVTETAEDITEGQEIDNGSQEGTTKRTSNALVQFKISLLLCLKISVILFYVR